MSGPESGFSYRILLIDDEASIRKTSAAVLASRGYELRTAADGFAALVELRRSLPDVIISDLHMPNMSGFEFLSIVRRRFPQIPVIAISGEFEGTAPSGLLADAFLGKGSYGPEELFHIIADLLERSPLRAQVTKPDKAPVWIPRNETGYFVLTCTECLRSFSIAEDQACAPDAFDEEIHEVDCVFCRAKVRYLCAAEVIINKRSQRQTA